MFRFHIELTILPIVQLIHWIFFIIGYIFVNLMTKPPSLNTLIFNNFFSG